MHRQQKAERAGAGSFFPARLPEADKCRGRDGRVRCALRLPQRTATGSTSEGAWRALCRTKNKKLIQGWGKKWFTQDAFDMLPERELSWILREVSNSCNETYRRKKTKRWRVMSERILRVRDLCERLGVSRTTLWRRVESGALPAPFKIGGPGTRAVGWFESVRWRCKSSR